MEHEQFKAHVFESKKWADALSREYSLEEPATCTSHHNALLLPPRYIEGSSRSFGDGLLEGGVCDASGAFVAGLNRSSDLADVNKNCVRGYDVAEQEIDFIDESVIFGGILTSHFGHMLCDGLTRMWYVAEHPEDRRTVAFLVMPNQVFKMWEMLELAGLEKERALIIERPTQFREVTVPGETCYSLKQPGYRREWQSLLRVISSSVEPGPYEKIYLTRTGLKNSGCVGEEYFEEFFRGKGFEIISPERFSFKEQVSLVAGAREIATTMGTLAYHAMFAKPGTEITILNRSTTMVPGAITAICAAGAKATFVDAFLNLLPEEQAGNCVFLLGPTKHWSDYLSDKGWQQEDEPRDYDLAGNVLEYARLWGQRYSSAAPFHWIRNEMGPHIAKRINRYLLGREIDISDYEMPRKYENLLTRNERLESDVERLSSRLKAAESQALLATYATIRPDGLDALVEGVVGATRPPLANAVLVLATADQEHPADRRISMPCTISRQDDETTIWSAKLVSREISELLGKSDALSVDATLMATAGESRLTLPVHINAQEQTYVGIPIGTSEDFAAIFPDFSALGAFAAIRNEQSAFGPTPAYRIEKLEWDGDDASFEFYVNNPLAHSDALSIRVVLAPDEGSAAGAQANPIETHAIASSFELGTKQRYTFSLKARAANCEDAADDNSKTMLFLIMENARTGNTVGTTPFGRRRPKGSYKPFGTKRVIDDGLLIEPFEDEDKNIGLRAMVIDEALGRYLRPFIESARWADGGLELTGRYESVHGLEGHVERSYLLVDDSGTTVLEAAKQADGEEGWSVLFDIASLSSGAIGASFHLALKKSVPGASKTEPFGRRREKGTLADFSCFMQRVPQGVLVPLKLDDGMLGFSLMSEDDALALSNAPYLEKLAWEEKTLHITVRLAVSIRDCPRFSPEIVLIDEEGKVKQLDESIIAENERNRLVIRASASPASLFSEADTGKWRLALKKTADETHVEIFGKRRPKGTLAAFQLIGTIYGRAKITTGDFGQSIGFKVHKMSLRDHLDRRHG